MSHLPLRQEKQLSKNQDINEDHVLLKNSKTHLLVEPQDNAFHVSENGEMIAVSYDSAQLFACSWLVLDVIKVTQFKDTTPYDLFPHFVPLNNFTFLKKNTSHLNFYIVFVYFVFGCAGSSLLLSLLSSCGCRGYSVVAVHWLLIVPASHCSYGAQALGHAGFSSCSTWTYLLWLLDSRAHNGYGTWTQLLHSMWDLSRPGIKPMSPALAGGYCITEPPGKPSSLVLMPGLVRASRGESQCRQIG